MVGGAGARYVTSNLPDAVEAATEIQLPYSIREGDLDRSPNYHTRLNTCSSTLIKSRVAKSFRLDLAETLQPIHAVVVGVHYRGYIIVFTTSVMSYMK